MPEEKEKSSSPIDFMTFILSLVSSAQIHLGLIPNPVTQKTESDLRAARQMIDILDILKEKTKGNLTNDEERLIDYVLYDLRMKFVEMSKTNPKS